MRPDDPQACLVSRESAARFAGHRLAHATLNRRWRRGRDLLAAGPQADQPSGPTPGRRPAAWVLRRL